jgi:STE24 endopeptidase
VSAQAILTLYLVLFAVRLAWESGLTLLNARHVRRVSAAPPDFVLRVMDRDTYGRSVDYTLTRGRFGLVSGLASAAIVIAVVASGALGALDSLVRGWPLPGYVDGLVYFFLMSTFFTLVSLPSSLYLQFVIEQRFGFNRMTPALFFADLARNLVVSAVLLTPVLLALFWFVDRTGPWWWVLGFAGVSLFQVVVTVVYPTLIAPLFNKFTPLADGSLKDKINGLAARLGFATNGILIMDGSKRSRHSNAYFTGLGKVKRVVLFDTLIDSLPEDSLVAVLAHEIGHEKKHHITKALAFSFVMLFAGFWILGLLIGYEPFYRAFGFAETSTYALLVIISFCAGPFTFFLAPLFAAWSRKHEYEADRYAVDATGGAAGLKEALLGLGRNNLSNLTPHPWYSFYHYSHPTLAERVAAMEAHEARGR